METEEPTDPRQSRFVRAASVVGDLDSSFYDEERDRDIWNEASAVGFQALLWGIPLACAVALWIVGAEAFIPVACMLVIWGIAAGVVLRYATRFGVDPGARAPLIGGRRLLFGVVLGLLGTGVLRAALDLEVTGNSFSSSFLRGMGQGAAFAGAVLLVILIVRVIIERTRAQR